MPLMTPGAKRNFALLLVTDVAVIALGFAFHPLAGGVALLLAAIVTAIFLFWARMIPERYVLLEAAERAWAQHGCPQPEWAGTPSQPGALPRALAMTFLWDHELNGITPDAWMRDPQLSTERWQIAGAVVGALSNPNRYINCHVRLIGDVIQFGMGVDHRTLPIGTINAFCLAPDTADPDLEPLAELRRNPLIGTGNARDRRVIVGSLRNGPLQWPLALVAPDMDALADWLRMKGVNEVHL